MIKLSDYLDYLNKEIIQARKKVDEAAIYYAKEYAKHDYLKFFKVPRYSMPTIKMDIPIKITNIDSDKKYNFKIDKDSFLNQINERIRVSNQTKDLKIPLMTQKQIADNSIQEIFRQLEKGDQRFGKVPLNEIGKLNLKEKVKTLKLSEFRIQDETTGKEAIELNNIFAETLVSNYKLVDSRLNQLYIDPDTSATEDKDKLFINLHVEMEEEGIRIIELKDREGKIVEQITFE